MIDATTTFDEIITVTMKNQGFDQKSSESMDDPENGNYRRLTFTKDGHEAFVTATLREIEMNNRQEPMISLCKARINNAVLTWNNSKNG